MLKAYLVDVVKVTTNKTGSLNPTRLVDLFLGRKLSNLRVAMKPCHDGDEVKKRQRSEAWIFYYSVLMLLSSTVMSVTYLN